MVVISIFRANKADQADLNKCSYELYTWIQESNAIIFTLLVSVMWHLNHHFLFAVSITILSNKLLHFMVFIHYGKLFL